MPLLALAVAHCGGKELSGQPAMGGASVGGASPLGGAGQINLPIGDDLVIPEGGGPTTDCNFLGDASPTTTSSIIADNPPAPEGGALSNGNYHLTKLEDFVGPGGSSRTGNHWHSSLIVSQSTGGSADLQFRWFELSGELPLAIEQNETIVVTGTSYAYTVTCATVRGSAEPGSGFFTATTQELILISPANPDGVTRVLTYTRD